MQRNGILEGVVEEIQHSFIHCLDTIPAVRLAGAQQARQRRRKERKVGKVQVSGAPNHNIIRFNRMSAGR